MKKAIALTLALVLALTLAACGGGNGPANNRQNQAGNPNGRDAADTDGIPGTAGGVIAKSREQALPLLTDYKIAVKASFDGEDELAYTELHWDKGHVTHLGDSISYSDYENQKHYMLDPAEKTGGAVALGDGEREGPLGDLLSNYLFAYDDYKELGEMVKVGNDTVAGRKAAVYAFADDDLSSGYYTKIWIDEEYGVALKLESIVEAVLDHPEVSTRFEVTEFKAGGVTIKDMVDLDEYEILDMTVPPGP
jgi:hypothetical protein